MTREEVAADDLLEGALVNLLKLKEPDRTQAVEEFWRRYQLVKDVAEAVKQGLAGFASRAHPDPHQSPGNQK